MSDTMLAPCPECGALGWVLPCSECGWSGCTCPEGKHVLDGAPCDPYAESDAEYTARCPACGDPIDYCRGHGPFGDPAGFAILDAHDDDDHSGCHPDGCEEAPERRLEYLRQEIRAERISYAELAELAELVPFIDERDVELLQWAGVPEKEVNR